MVSIAIRQPGDDAIPIRGLSFKNNKGVTRSTLLLYVAICASSVLMLVALLSEANKVPIGGTQFLDNSTLGATSNLVKNMREGGRLPFSHAPWATSSPESCMNKNGVIRIPAVRKGLNNQRMRIVQDIVIAKMLGMAVELPKIVRTRIDCGYRESCYQNYSSHVEFDRVFDRETIIKKLKSLNICVVESAFSVTDVPVIAGKDGSFCYSKILFLMISFTRANDLSQVFRGHSLHPSSRISLRGRTI